ncbi:MAG: hypothetical protein IH851_07850 [Armatimonadetes bacterium]|nr:hypothetical protein [Armatimonadota bacterium]
MMIALAAALTIFGAPQAERPLIFHDFETRSYGWRALNEGHSVDRTTNSLDVKNGTGALEFMFVPSAGQMSGMMLELGDISGAEGMTFWIKASRATAIAVGLFEQDEEEYVIVVNVPANRWLHVKANFEDFILTDESPLLNRRLDVEKIRAVLMLDLIATIAVGSDIGELLFGSRTGSNALWLDDFALLQKAPAPKLKREPLVIDSFDRDYTSWIPLQGVTLEPILGKGMRVSYERQLGRIPGLLKGISPTSLKGAKEIVFTLRCPQETSFIIRLEETDGEKWQVEARAPGGNESADMAIPLADFSPADDSELKDGRISPENLKLVFMADLTEAEPGTKNEFWIEKVFAR